MRFTAMNPLVLLAAMPLAAPASPSIAAMTWHRRILVVSAARADDAMLAAQHRIVARWRAGGDARDVSVVTAVGDRVSGTSDSAAKVRHAFRLPETGFAAVLIGKDGGVKLRSHSPIAAETLESTIDAMPMRRAGER